MDNDALYLDRIVDATELLIENIPKLDNSKSHADRADFFLKLAIAYFIQNDKPKAQSYILEAINIISENSDEIFISLVNIWQQIIFDAISFEDRLSKMNGNQKRIFEIVLWYSSLIYHEIPREYAEALSCVIQGSLIFCSKKMMCNPIEKKNFPLDFDTDKELFFFTVSGKKLYYAGNDIKYILHNFEFTNQIEQQPYSPHLYFTEEFCVRTGDVFCDIGAGEANIALSVVDKCSEVYVFEGDEKWMDALTATFMPFKSKSTIIRKKVSDISSDDFINLDDYFDDRRVDFLKIDVEGYELNVLHGAKNVIKNNPQLRMCICTYHKGCDAYKIKDFLDGYGFKIEFSDGFMLFNEDPDFYIGSAPEYPYFRYGLIRAWREEII